MVELVVTALIQLVPLTPNHAEAIFSLVDRNRLMLREHLPWVDFTRSKKDTEAYIGSCQNLLDGQLPSQFVILYKGEPAGLLGIHQLDSTNKGSSLGYWLAEEYQGHGIMKQSVSSLIMYLFENTEAQRVQLAIGTTNSKSQRVAESLGFTKEGTLRRVEWVNDHFADHHIYGLLKEEL